MDFEAITAIIDENEEVFEDAFLFTDVSDEEIQSAEKRLGVEIVRDYKKFLKKYGHGGFFFEFLGFGTNGKALFVDETLKFRKSGLPNKFMVFENCDEYVRCINSETGEVVNWSSHDSEGTVHEFNSFCECFLDAVENAIDNFDE